MSPKSKTSGRVYPGAVRQFARPSAKTIMVAEDDEDSRSMMETLLRMKGYEVVEAENGLEAVEIALTNSPDLILLDLELPLLDGLGVTRNLRRRPKFKQVPIVVVSGHDPTKHSEAALDAGASAYLVKPIDFQRLDQILANAVPLVDLIPERARARTA
jgi:two-component system, cell cycle response regulator DivK